MFRKFNLISDLLLLAPILGLHAWAAAQPDRQPGSDRTLLLRAQPVSFGPAGFGKARPAGAWQLSGDDPRFGGISGLALKDGELVALTDSGVVVNIDLRGLPSGFLSARLHDLPAGPGAPFLKASRDSEALLADSEGNGWWVSFENRHSLWRYDQAFSNVLAPPLPIRANWQPNLGIEAVMQGAKGRITAFPEGGGESLAVEGRAVVRQAASRLHWGISEAVRLRGGRVLLIERRPGPLGVRSRLVEWDEKSRSVRPAYTLPLGRLDNPEAIAAAPLANGGTRLWIMTDNNFRPWMRTLLIALDLPRGADRPGRKP